MAIDALAAAAADCDIIVSDRRAEGSADLLSRLPRLVALCRCAVDIRNVDVAAASAQGILVTQASAGFMTAVAEWVLGVMIDLSRHLSAAVLQYRAGAQPPARMGRELRGATLGLIGYGQIGRQLADVALALGMRVVVCDPYARVVHPALSQLPLPELLAAADHVVCLAGATAETENLMDAAAFAAMKPSAFLSTPRAATWSTKPHCCRRWMPASSPVVRSTSAARPTRCRARCWHATRT